MSEQLDRILDNYINKKTNEELGIDVDADRNYILDAAKSEIKNQVYREVSAEIRDQALREAEDIIEERVSTKRLEEYKKLAVEGFVLAIVVGLLVNQVTEIIAFYKGSIALESIYSTIIISVVLVVICAVVFIYIFLKTLLSMWREVKKNATD